MAKITTEATQIVNTKVLDALGAKKEPVGKTIFRLSPQSDSFLRALAKSSKLTIREFLDSLATIAEQAHANGKFPEPSAPQDGTRMSYAISKKAKEIFTKIARERNISRDCVVNNALLYITQEFQKHTLTIQEKITYAKILIKARDDMLRIYRSESVSTARERLSSCGDQDFSDCEEKFAYIEQLFELNLEKFIMLKKETENKCYIDNTTT